MKPSGQLHRHTPLRSTARLAPRSKRRAQMDRASASVLREFANAFPECWRCGGTVGLTCHHIGGRDHPARHARANLARLCDGPGSKQCHRLVTEYRIESPLAYCLGLKQRFDGKFYDRELVLAIRGLAFSAVTQDEVDAYSEHVQ